MVVWCRSGCAALAHVGRRSTTIYHLLFTVHLSRLSRPQRVENAEGCARCGREFVERYRRATSFKHGGADGAHLFALALVLRAQLRNLFSSVSVSDSAAEVFDDEGTARAENLDALFGERAVAFGKISDRAVRAVGELECDEDRVVVRPLLVV